MKIVIEYVDWHTRQQDLLQIRYKVFVDEQGVPPELEHDDHDQSALHLLVSSERGEPIATARMLPDGHIGRMAVLQSWRNRGIGSTMLRELVQIASSNGIEKVFLHAQCQAEPFYHRLGFTSEGEVFDDAGIDHRRMTMRIELDAD